MKRFCPKKTDKSVDTGFLLFYNILDMFRTVYGYIPKGKGEKAMSPVLIKIIAALSSVVMLFTAPGGHIAGSLFNSFCPEYLDVKEDYVPTPLDGKAVYFEHPYLATEGQNGMHSNSYNNGAYDFDGPTGKNIQVNSKSMNVFGGLCATTMFDSKGRIMCVSGNVLGFRVLLLDPDTLDIICETRLPQRASTVEAIKKFQFSKISEDTSGGAYCHLLKGDRPIIGNSDNVIQVFTVDESGSKPRWVVEREWDVMDYLPAGSFITDAIPDYDGNVWFVTRPGEVGYVANALNDNDPSNDSVHVINLGALTKTDVKEEIQNTLAVCDDGIYIVSDYAMYRFEIGEDGNPSYTWRTLYDRGTTLKPGAINQGSGTTPTLLDCPILDEQGEPTGEISRLVAITDNADNQINVVVYERETGKVVGEVPCFTPGKSVSENSLIAFGRSFIVENNYSEKGAAFLKMNPSSEQGVWCVDMNNDCTDAFVKWKSEEASCTVVPKLSTKTGLVYLYTREYGHGIPSFTVAWYLTAIDFRTGETVFKVHTGNGVNWNNSYGPITIGPNGAAYVGVFNGIISVRDGQ